MIRHAGPHSAAPALGRPYNVTVTSQTSKGPMESKEVCLCRGIFTAIEQEHNVVGRHGRVLGHSGTVVRIGGGRNAPAAGVLPTNSPPTPHSFASEKSVPSSARAREFLRIISLF